MKELLKQGWNSQDQAFVNDFLYVLFELRYKMYIVRLEKDSTLCIYSPALHGDEICLKLFLRCVCVGGGRQIAYTRAKAKNSSIPRNQHCVALLFHWPFLFGAMMEVLPQSCNLRIQTPLIYLLCSETHLRDEMYFVYPRQIIHFDPSNENQEVMKSVN